MVEIGSVAERQHFLYYNFGSSIADNHLKLLFFRLKAPVRKVFTHRILAAIHVSRNTAACPHAHECKLAVIVFLRDVILATRATHTRNRAARASHNLLFSHIVSVSLVYLLGPALLAVHLPYACEAIRGIVVLVSTLVVLSVRHKRSIKLRPQPLPTNGELYVLLTPSRRG